MKLQKYLFVPWAAIVFYALSTLFFGPTGAASYKALLAEREEILENLEELERINLELEGTMDALLHDSETIKIRGRELGYGEKNEHFVRIVGLSGVRFREISPGKMKTAKKPVFVSDTPLRIISALIALGFFMLFAAGDMVFKAKKGRNRNFSATPWPESPFKSGF